MPLIAMLCCADIFSELATQLYINEIGGLYSTKLYPTLSRVFATPKAIHSINFERDIF